MNWNIIKVYIVIGLWLMIVSSVMGSIVKYDLATIPEWLAKNIETKIDFLLVITGICGLFVGSHINGRKE